MYVNLKENKFLSVRLLSSMDVCYSCLYSCIHIVCEVWFLSLYSAKNPDDAELEDTLQSVVSNVYCVLCVFK